MNLNFYQRVTRLQNLVKANKDKFNKFGNFYYRSVEGIFEAVKPHLKDLELSLYLTDNIVEKNGRFYIQATATLTDGVTKIESNGFAREADTKKGMDEAQVTGSASSYARKYAVCSLLLLDDNKDIDSTSNKIKSKVSKEETGEVDNRRMLFEKMKHYGLKTDEMKQFLDFVKCDAKNENQLQDLLNQDLQKLIQDFKNHNDNMEGAIELQ